MLVDQSYLNFNTNQAGKVKPRILVAPLDWGLGHATRCISIVRELLRQDCDIWIGAEGSVRKLMEAEFPQLSFIHLSGYNIHYSNSAKGFGWKMARQLAKIRKAIAYENSWLKEQVDRYGFDAVISDNRFGLYHRDITSIFITHQLLVKSPFGKWSEGLLQKWNYSYINRFTACWIPDFAGENNLAGELSHPLKKPSIPINYIGALSRLEKQSLLIKKNNLLVLLSGPEPQRTMLECKIIDELNVFDGSAIIVRGLPLETTIPFSAKNVSVYNHLPSVELAKKIEEAEFIISRTGYSTVMDLVWLGKKSILIPTPGQTEQEYLGTFLMKNKIAWTVSQDKFSLTEALANATQFPYNFPNYQELKLVETIKLFIEGLKTRK